MFYFYFEMNECFSFFVFLSFNQPIVKRCKKVFDYLRIRRQLQLYVFVFTCRICFYISVKSFRFTWQWISVNWIKISMCSTFTVAANNKYNNYWPLVFRLTNNGTTTTDVLLTCKWGGMQMASVGGNKKKTTGLGVNSNRIWIILPEKTHWFFEEHVIFRTIGFHLATGEPSTGSRCNVLTACLIGGHAKSNLD